MSSIEGQSRQLCALDQKHRDSLGRSLIVQALVARGILRRPSHVHKMLRLVLQNFALSDLALSGQDLSTT